MDFGGKTLKLKPGLFYFFYVTTFKARLVHIGTVKFARLFQESPCSPVVTFPSFGSEGHGVQPPQGDSFFFSIFVLQFTYIFSYNTFLSFQPSHANVKFFFIKNTSNVLDSKVYLSCFVLFIHSLFFSLNEIERSAKERILIERLLFFRCLL